MTPDRENEIRFWLRRTAERDTKPKPTYQTATPNTDPVKAASEFEAKYGYPPNKQFREFGLLWTGPVRTNP